MENPNNDLIKLKREKFGESRIVNNGSLLWYLYESFSDLKKKKKGKTKKNKK